VTVELDVAAGKEVEAVFVETPLCLSISIALCTGTDGRMDTLGNSEEEPVIQAGGCVRTVAAKEQSMAKGTNWFTRSIVRGE
jgi:hypothetical protein